MTHKTTLKHFALFKKHVHVWLDHFGLKDWEIILSHSIPEDCKGALAACEVDMTSRFCTIYLNPKWNRATTDELIKNSAFHEVCELLLGPLDICAKARHITEDEIDSERHGVIARLYNSIAQEKYRK